MRLAPQFQIGLHNPVCLLSLGWSPFSPDSSSVSQSHKRENLGKSGTAWKLTIKDLHQARRDERVLGALHEILSKEKRWRICGPLEQLALSPLSALSTQQQACDPGGRTKAYRSSNVGLGRGSLLGQSGSAPSRGPLSGAGAGDVGDALLPSLETRPAHVRPRFGIAGTSRSPAKAQPSHLCSQTLPTDLW